MELTSIFPHPGIHPSIAKRSSSRVYDPDRPVGQEELLLLLEAARAAPSSSNQQPWRYLIFDDSNPDALKKARETLNPGNQVWANHAPLLLLALAEEIRPDGRINTSALHDLGLANQNIFLQATSMGLNSRPMGGFNSEKAREYFNIPEEYQPVIMIAIGYPAQPEQIPWPVLEKESLPRLRKPVDSFAFRGGWNQRFLDN